jgi:adenine-specific DNA-methyltransferase
MMTLSSRQGLRPCSTALNDAMTQARPVQVEMLNSCVVGKSWVGADEQLANLQLELHGLDMGLTVI